MQKSQDIVPFKEIKEMTSKEKAFLEKKGLGFGYYDSETEKLVVRITRTEGYG